MKHKSVKLEKVIIDETNEHLLTQYNIESYPTLLLVKGNKQRIMYNDDDRKIRKIIDFLKVNKAF